TGGAVRLAGSGLGCPDWPTCAKGSVVAPLEWHAWVEFGNRLVTGLVSVVVILAVLGSLVRAPRRRDLTLLSLGLVAGVIAQIVLIYQAAIGDLQYVSKLPALLVGIHIAGATGVWMATVWLNCGLYVPAAELEREPELVAA